MPEVTDHNCPRLEIGSERLRQTTNQAPPHHLAHWQSPTMRLLIARLTLRRTYNIHADATPRCFRGVSSPPVPTALLAGPARVSGAARTVQSCNMHRYTMYVSVCCVCMLAGAGLSSPARVACGGPPAQSAPATRGGNRVSSISSPLTKLTYPAPALPLYQEVSTSKLLQPYTLQSTITCSQIALCP